MAITLTSNSETADQLAAGIQKIGDKATVKDEAVVEKPVEEKEKKPAETEVPGDKLPAETGSESVATKTEVVEEKPAQEGSQEPEDKAKPKSKGGYQSKIEKQAREINRIREDLEAERGDKTRLRQELEQAQARLAELQPKDEKKPTGPVRPVEPEMPDLEELEFDQERYSAAKKQYKLDKAKYNSDLEKYEQEMIDFRVSKQLDEAQKQRQVNEARAKQQRVYDEFVERKDSQSAEYEDWDEHFGPGSEDTDVSDVVEAAVMLSDNPAHLMMYFKLHPDELQKIEAIEHPIARTKEIDRLENKIMAERAKPESKDEKKAETKPEKTETPTAKPTTKPVPEAPLETVGGKTTAVNNDLAGLYAQHQAAVTAGDARKVRELTALIKAKQKPAGK